MKTSKTILGFALIASGLFYLSLLWPKTEKIYAGPIATNVAVSPLPWKPYSEDALKGAALAGKPVLVDFFADWCLACHELEEKTFSHPQVKEALKEFVLLRFDATNESPQLETLKSKYKIVGLPTIIFYDGKGNWLTTLTLNEFEDQEKFLERLKKITF